MQVVAGGGTGGAHITDGLSLGHNFPFGDAPLDQALALFEEGSALMKKCSTMLNRAEQKVSKLIAGPDGAPAERPMDGEDRT